MAVTTQNTQKENVKQQVAVNADAVKNHEADNTQARLIDNVKVNITYKNDAAPATEEEIRAYIHRGNVRNPNTVVSAIDLLFDGDEVEVNYDLSPVPFDRIRRITGYLVGTMDRWNDAKTAEENDRVKHSLIK